MTIAKYAHENGYTKRECEKLKKAVERIAFYISEWAFKNPAFILDSGIFYKTSDLLNLENAGLQSENNFTDEKRLIISELKKYGFEFIDNGEKFRF